MAGPSVTHQPVKRTAAEFTLGFVVEALIARQLLTRAQAKELSTKEGAARARLERPGKTSKTPRRNRPAYQNKNRRSFWERRFLFRGFRGGWPPPS